MRGSIFFELFHLSLQTKLVVRFEGAELLPSRLARRLLEPRDPGSSSEESEQVGRRFELPPHKVSPGKSRLPEIKVPRSKQRANETVQMAPNSTIRVAQGTPSLHKSQNS